MSDIEEEEYVDDDNGMACDEDYEYEYADDEPDYFDEPGNNHNEALAPSNSFDILLGDLPKESPFYSELLHIYNTVRELVLTCPYAVYLEWDFRSTKNFRSCSLLVYGPGKASRPYQFKLDFPPPPKTYPEAPPMLTPLRGLPALIFIGISLHPLLAQRTWNPCQHVNVLFRNMISLLETWEAYSRVPSVTEMHEAYKGGVTGFDLPASDPKAPLEVNITALTALYMTPVRRIFPDFDATMEVLEKFDAGRGGEVVAPCDPAKTLHSADRTKPSGIGYSKGAVVGLVPAVVSKDKPLLTRIVRQVSAMLPPLPQCPQLQDPSAPTPCPVASYAWVLASPLPELLVCMLGECSAEEVLREQAYVGEIFALALRLEIMHALLAQRQGAKEKEVYAQENYTEKRAGTVQDTLQELLRRFLGYERMQLFDDPGGFVGSVHRWIADLQEYSPMLAGLRAAAAAATSPSRPPSASATDADGAMESAAEDSFASASASSSSSSSALAQRVYHIDAEGTSHYYLKTGAVAVKASTKWLKELRFIEHNLPSEVTLFVSESQPSYLIASMVMANKDTAYYGGFYVFHIQVPADYPQSNPQVHFMTTGEGQVRFNPNLYNCGKVCLSLLGTWQGERWNPQTSNMTQVLSSILYLIFTEQPYFNEPGFDNSRGTPEGDRRSLLYDEEVFRNMVEYAVYYHLTHMHIYPAAVQRTIRAYYLEHWDAHILPLLQEKCAGVYKNVGARVLKRLGDISAVIAQWRTRPSSSSSSAATADLQEGEASDGSRKRAKK